VSVVHVALEAARDLLSFAYFPYLAGGALIGLVVGIIPGLGGLAGLSLLLPFTFGLDPHAAIAAMMGLAAAVAIGDTIPAVLLGVPGSVGSAATVVDGYPMSCKGEAGRALSAAFMASMSGGLFGAVFLLFFIPIMRPAVLMFGIPELLAICIFGLSLVASLSGRAPLRGVIGVVIGLLLASIGQDPRTATQRWTFDLLYLWDGLPIVPLALGLFALPELAELAVRKSQIATAHSRLSHRLAGLRDVWNNKFLVFRCSLIGSALGAIPGVGASVIDWIAYSHALTTENGAKETFGTGDVRGVLASESSNNAKEGGALVPTIAFGVPGTAGMALLMAALQMQGIVPGPDLLGSRMDITFTLVWSLVIANCIGTGVCFLFANQLARIATIPAGYLLPAVIGIVFIGAYEASRSWGDLVFLLSVGVLGYLMKLQGWPRAPILLGFVLGGLIDRYMFISIQLYGAGWIARPAVAIMLLLAFYMAFGTSIRRFFRGGGTHTLRRRPHLSAPSLFTLAIVIAFAVAMLSAMAWPLEARVIPEIVISIGIVAGVAAFLAQVMIDPGAADAAAATGADAPTTFADVSPRLVASRSLAFFGWLIAALVACWFFGILYGILLLTLAYPILEARERLGKVAIYAACIFLCYWLLFEEILRTPWPETLLTPPLPSIAWLKSLF
jgi:TctA family transporter